MFERGRSGVRPTSAGQQFFEDVRQLLFRFDLAVERVQTAGRADNGCVRIGVFGTLASSYLGRLLKRFREEHPQVGIDICEGQQAEHSAAILDRSLDIAFILGNPSPEQFSSEVLWVEPIMAALQVDDPRSLVSELPLAAFKHDSFVVSSDAPGIEVHDLVIRRLSSETIHPTITRYKVGRSALLTMVGLGFGISLICSSEKLLRHPGVSFVPITNEFARFSAIWLPGNDNPAFRRFLSLAREMSRTERIAATS